MSDGELATEVNEQIDAVLADSKVGFLPVSSLVPVADRLKVAAGIPTLVQIAGFDSPFIRLEESDV